MVIDILETLIALGAKVLIFAVVVYFVTKKAVASALEEQVTKMQETKNEPS